MNMYHFQTKYESALSELGKVLDSYLQGLWYKYDYLEFEQRTLISLEYFNDRVVADVIFAGRPELKIEFKEIDDKLIVREVSRYDALSGAYMDDVLNLQFKAQGKSEKEIAALNIEELSKEFNNASKKIVTLQNKKQEIANQIGELESRI